MNKIDELLQQLDSIASSYDKDQYGLPLKGFESARTVPELRDVVKQFLVTEFGNFEEYATDRTNGECVWLSEYMSDYLKEKGYEIL